MSVFDVPQKPLRRIDIEEVSDNVSVAESAGSTSLIQEVVREAEDKSSPLSTSPTAKMIKIDEVAEASSHQPAEFVAPPSLS